MINIILDVLVCGITEYFDLVFLFYSPPGLVKIRHNSKTLSGTSHPNALSDVFIVQLHIKRDVWTVGYLEL